MRGEKKMQTTIQVSGLPKSYSTLHVIRNLDLTVSRGEVFGLLGANGAGKSTAIECMLGTKRPMEAAFRFWE